MNISKKTSRADLETAFSRNKIPDETDFKNFIGAGVNQKDDGLARPEGEPVSIAAEPSGSKPVLKLYASVTDGEPEWTLSLRDSDTDTAKPALVISDADRIPRLAIDPETEQITIGALVTTGPIVAEGAITANAGMSVPRGQILDVHTLRGIPSGSTGGSTSGSAALAVAGSQKSGEPPKPPLGDRQLTIVADVQVEGKLTVATGRPFTAGGTATVKDLLTASGGLNVSGVPAKIQETLDVPGGIRIGPGNISDHLNVDGAFYRYGYNAYITVDDRLYIRKSGAAEAMFLFCMGNQGNGLGIGLGTGTPQSALDVRAVERQISANDYADMSANGNGYGLFAGNAYLVQDQFRYAKEKAGMGAIGFAVNYPEWNKASVISSNDTKSKANLPFTPVKIATFSTDGLEIAAGKSLGVRTSPTTEYALDVKGDMRLLGNFRGYPNDYARAQHTLYGGGVVTWGGPGGRLRWTKEFVATTPMRPSASNPGWVGIGPTADGLKVIQHWQPYEERSADKTGIVLNEQEALYAVHVPTGQAHAVTLRVVDLKNPYEALSNWILVAIVQGGEGKLKLGTGTILDYWRVPELGTNWVRYRSDFGSAPGYFKDTAGIVHLRGLLKAVPLLSPIPFNWSTSNTTSSGKPEYLLMKLPEGYLPATRLLFAVISSHEEDKITPGRVDIDPAGNVWATHGGGLGICLDGISFLAEN